MSFLADRVAASMGQRVEAFQHTLATPGRTTRTTVVIGRLLGLGFAVCLLTGLYSHFLQDPLPWMRFPTWPPNLYRVTQGLHVATGIACIPLLLAKLWSVFPLVFAFPPFRTMGQALERVSIAVLISSAVVQLVTGVLNTYQWYPFPWAFRDVHYPLSWIITGSLLLHVAVQLPKIIRYWRDRTPVAANSTPTPTGRVR